MICCAILATVCYVSLSLNLLIAENLLIITCNLLGTCMWTEPSFSLIKESEGTLATQ